MDLSMVVHFCPSGQGSLPADRGGDHEQGHQIDDRAAGGHRAAVRLWSCVQRSCDLIPVKPNVIKHGFVANDPGCRNHTEDRRSADGVRVAKASPRHPAQPAPAPAPAPVVPGNGATALCNDGTYSFAAHHQGACSHHGGVKVFYK
jgi:Protein of unknown function (DUF3761)